VATPTPEQLELSLFTEAEVIAMLEAAGMATLAADKVLVAYLTNSLSQQVIAASPQLYETLRQALTIPMPPAAMEEVMRRAREEAKELIKNVAQTDFTAMGEAIARGLEAGQNSETIAKTLDMVQGLDNVRAAKLEKYAADLQASGLSQAEIEKRIAAMKEDLLEDRRRTIAATEGANARAVADYVEAQASGKQWKIAISVGDDRVSDICQANEAEGWIPFDDDFPSGDDRPPFHPNCRCVLGYRTDPPDADDRQHAEDRAEATQKAKGDTDES